MGYITVEKFEATEFFEKKSRFIGHITPVKTRQEADEFIATISKKHYDATHNVFAYVLRDGGGCPIKRYSDDGEPQGTAGIPVLDVLEKAKIVDTCIVVTRYFGGTMLGAGGLVRAYSHSASITVVSANLLCMLECLEISIECEYNFYNKLLHILPNFKARVENSDFGAAVTMKITFEKGDYNSFLKQINELSNGEIIPKIVGERFDNIE